MCPVYRWQTSFCHTLDNTAPQFLVSVLSSQHNAVCLFLSADVVNLDLKSTLRVLYTLFTKYKDVE